MNVFIGFDKKIPGILYVASSQEKAEEFKERLEMIFSMLTVEIEEIMVDQIGGLDQLSARIYV